MAAVPAAAFRDGHRVLTTYCSALRLTCLTHKTIWATALHQRVRAAGGTQLLRCTIGNTNFEHSLGADAGIAAVCYATDMKQCVTGADLSLAEPFDNVHGGGAGTGLQLGGLIEDSGSHGRADRREFQGDAPLHMPQHASAHRALPGPGKQLCRKAMDDADRPAADQWGHCLRPCGFVRHKLRGGMTSPGMQSQCGG